MLWRLSFIVSGTLRYGRRILFFLDSTITVATKIDQGSVSPGRWRRPHFSISPAPCKMSFSFSCVTGKKLILSPTQAFHNISPENHHTVDPLLTPFGEEQCVNLRENFPHHPNISLLISSPFRRTIYTTLLAFAPSLANGHCRPSIIALPEIQETSDFPCDIGSDVDRLRQEMEEKHVPVDLSLVKEGWNVKTPGSKWAPSPEALSARAREARRYVRDQIDDLQRRGEKDPEVVVVSHGGFLHYFTEDWEDCKAYSGE